jgi:long-chain acyl-CoA synthetase
VTATRSVRSTLHGKHVLVTGVTGFLGKVWLTMVLDHVPEIGRVSVLIRSNRKGTAEERFWQIAERSPAFRPLREKLGRARFHDFVAEKVRVLDGDVGREHCGLDQEALARVACEVDAVVHFAGLTDFEPDPLLGLATNTWGGENAADVAAMLRVPRFLHVSTAFVAGNVSGRIPESITPGVSPNGTRFDPHHVAEELGHALQKLEAKKARIDLANEKAVELGWPNIYTFTKGLSEHLHALRGDLDVTIVRPSVVESSRAYPFAGWNEGINTSGPLVWLLSSWFRKFPSNPHHHFDVVPVDTVARGTLLVLAAKLRGEAARVYHFGSSATNPLFFERAIDLTALGARRMHSKDGAAPLDRFVTKFLDAVPRDADHDPFPSLPLLRKGVQKARDFLRDFSPKETLPPKLYTKWGDRIEEKVKSLSMDCRNADRTIARIEDMLRLYRPFIHDNDYVYENGQVLALSEALDDEERALFAFDIATLDWRDYWLNVHVPGLEKWSLPLLRNERVPEDPPFPRPRALGASTAAHAPTDSHGSGTFARPPVDARAGDVEPRHAVIQEERR